MNRIVCPQCLVRVEHDRGYLKEHTVTVVRGELTVGNSMCNGSNMKPNVPLKTIKYRGNCPVCMTPHEYDFTETFPGSLVMYGGLIECACSECGPDQAVRLSDHHVIVEDD